MLTFLIKTPDSSLPTNATQNHAWIDKFSDGDNVLLIDYPTDPMPEYGINGTMIGAWNKDGTIADGYTVDQALYQELRPLGNVDGVATSLLRYSYPAGMEQYHLRVDGFYPEDNQPLYIETRHIEHLDGWGWQSELLYADKDPSVYAMYVHNDGYTTGGFHLATSAWQTDEDGNPLQVYLTRVADGFQKPSKVDWDISVLWASLFRGRATLEADQDSIKYLYWDNNADGGTVPGPADWTDSGQTVQSMAGTVTLVEDKSLFPVGTDIRIDGHESEVTGHWAGGEGIILNPYKAHAAGATVWYKS